MTVTGPRIKDYTGETASGLPVDIVADPLFELLLSLFVYSSHDAGELADFAVDPSWYDRVREQASPDLSTGLDRLAGLGGVWVALIGEALALGPDRSPEALATRLRERDPAKLWEDLLGLAREHCHTQEERDLVGAAVAGDASALKRVVSGDGCEIPDALCRLLETPPTESTELLAGTLLSFARDVFGDGDEVGIVLARDADHKRALAGTMESPQLVETATNGVTFTMVPDVDRIVLIPSVVIRPWVTITEHERSRVFCYPVAEQHLDADADTPPAWLVEVYKALGDERRLRLLKILRDGPASLSDITARIALAKSTVHHHLSVLRRAGLVRITLGAESEYSLRGGAVPDAARLLAGFLEDE